MSNVYHVSVLAGSELIRQFVDVGIEQSYVIVHPDDDDIRKCKRKCLSQSENNNVRISFVKHLIISTHLILCPSRWTT